MIDSSIVKTYMELGALATFFIIALTLLYKYFDKVIAGQTKDTPEVLLKKSQAKVNRLTQSDLLLHGFFMHMQIAISTVIPAIHMDTLQKRDCMVDFLLIKFSVFIDIARNFCKTKVASGLTKNGDQWLCELQDAIVKGVKEYEDKARKTGVPEIFIKHFNDRHVGRVSETLDLLSAISKSDIFHNNAMRTWAALDILTAIFNSTLIDAEHTMRRMNGEIDEALVGYKRSIL